MKFKIAYSFFVLSLLIHVLHANDSTSDNSTPTQAVPWNTSEVPMGIPLDSTFAHAVAQQLDLSPRKTTVVVINKSRERLLLALTFVNATEIIESNGENTLVKQCNGRGLISYVLSHGSMFAIRHVAPELSPDFLSYNLYKISCTPEHEFKFSRLVIENESF